MAAVATRPARAAQHTDFRSGNEMAALSAQHIDFHLMGYYPILDRAPKGRDEGAAWQLWIRRHDEYDPSAAAG